MASVGYKVNWDSVSRKTSGSKYGYFFGAGFAYHLMNNLTLNAEYNMQNLNVPTPNLGGNTINNAKTNIGVAKIGVAYHF